MEDFTKTLLDNAGVGVIYRGAPKIQLWDLNKIHPQVRHINAGKTSHTIHAQRLKPHTHALNQDAYMHQIKLHISIRSSYTHQHARATHTNTHEQHTLISMFVLALHYSIYPMHVKGTSEHAKQPHNSPSVQHLL